MTKDQKKDIQKQEARDGRIVVNKEKETLVHPFTTYMYSNNGKGDLYESVVNPVS
jgi:hypothetical protein